MLTPYRPEPYVNFAEPEPRQRMLAALNDVRARLGQAYPLDIAGRKVTTRDTWASRMPARPDTVVGYVSEATGEHAEAAIQAAWAAFPMWSRVAPETRARVLFRAAAIMRRRLYELSAWECFEESKSWIEAYADVCESIDFLEFYGREAIRLGGPQPITPIAGEDGELRYIPLGVVSVIPPWNFPLAICTGMTTAALAAGNTVVLKPARQSKVMAALLVDILEEAGLPRGVLQYVPGDPLAVGRLMVEHPLTRLIAFTGSKRVGLEIYEQAAKVHPGQKWLKRSVMELGGKDSIVVDETWRDLDAAADGIVASAFGFQGQKCSACSRLIVHRDVHDALLEKVVERASRLTVGDTTSEENFYMGALIDEAAQKKSLSYIEIGKGEGRMVLGPGVGFRTGSAGVSPASATGSAGVSPASATGSAGVSPAGGRAGGASKPTTEFARSYAQDAEAGRAGGDARSPRAGWFVPPTIFDGVAPDARLAQEEIFGPVLAVITAKDFDECLEIANNTEYGLTGSLYSQSALRLQRAREEFHVGNLYLNRKCTGALVDVHPFGGFNMSGTDSKAGGRDYLLLFLQGKTIAEKL